MRIAFVGKGGSGKTTAAAMFGRYVAERGHRVVAIDADINQHLALAFGHDGPPPRPLGADLGWLKDHLREDNPRIASGAMIKTTPREDWCGRALPQPPCRRARRVRGGGHDRGGGRVRVGTVHPVRPDSAGL
jgi:CO dehydrogenase nickel-insertion accessory protein CooC1